MNNKKTVFSILVIIVILIITAGIIFFVQGNKKIKMVKTAEGIEIPIPQGFEKLDITNKIDEGIVIEDEEGNQFVWVPVNISEFERNTFGIDSTPLGYRTILTDEADKDIQWNTLANEELATKSGGIWEPKEEQEYKDLLESVKKYSGFYIGRYEATWASGDSIENCKPGSKKSTEATEKRAVNKSGALFNYVSANESYEISKRMYQDNPTVVSHLTYGIEWDAALQWMLKTGTRTQEEITQDSSTWGNTYIDSFSHTIGIINTGAFEETKSNNIYDMAGNLFEWTREYFGTEPCAINRGGNMRSYKYDDEIYNLSAASRTWQTKGGNDQKLSSIGFRVCLYVK